MHTRGQLTRRPDGRYDPAVADAQFAEHRHPGRRRRNAGADDDEKPRDYWTELTRKTKADADLKEMEQRKRAGELVEAAEVQDAAVRAAKAVRDALRNIPTRLAGLLAAETDQHRILVLLTDEIDRSLAALNGHRPPRQPARPRR